MSPSEEVNSGVPITGDQLVVILDIDFKETWRFLTVPGLWRRLTMNIFGNALKYTPSGFIKIKLGCQKIPTLSSKDGNTKSLVTLSISDSGLGISPEFIKNRLFKPFSQVRIHPHNLPGWYIC